jgi:hypothetical protein
MADWFVATVYLTGGSIYLLQYAGRSAPETVAHSGKLSIWRCYCAGSGDLRLCLQLCVHRAILVEREESGRQCEPRYLAPCGGGCGHLHGETSRPHPWTPRCGLPRPEGHLEHTHLDVASPSRRSSFCRQSQIVVRSFLWRSSKPRCYENQVGLPC